MNTDIFYRLVFMGILAVMLGLAASIFYIGGYLAAPEEKKLGRAKGMMRFGIVWLFFGFGYLVCCLLALWGHLGK